MVFIPSHSFKGWQATSRSLGTQPLRGTTELLFCLCAMQWKVKVSEAKQGLKRGCKRARLWMDVRRETAADFQETASCCLHPYVPASLAAGRTSGLSVSTPGRATVVQSLNVLECYASSCSHFHSHVHTCSVWTRRCAIVKAKCGSQEDEETIVPRLPVWHIES